MLIRPETRCVDQTAFKGELMIQRRGGRASAMEQPTCCRSGDEKQETGGNRNEPFALLLFGRSCCDDACCCGSGCSGKAFEIEGQVARRLKPLQWFFFEAATDDAFKSGPNGLARHG